MLINGIGCVYVYNIKYNILNYRTHRQDTLYRRTWDRQLRTGALMPF